VTHVRLGVGVSCHALHGLAWPCACSSGVYMQTKWGRPDGEAELPRCMSLCGGWGDACSRDMYSQWCNTLAADTASDLLGLVGTVAAADAGQGLPCASYCSSGICAVSGRPVGKTELPRCMSLCGGWGGALSRDSRWGTLRQPTQPQSLDFLKVTQGRAPPTAWLPCPSWLGLALRVFIRCSNCKMGGAGQTARRHCQG
jgi:hypothetical protein